MYFSLILLNIKGHWKRKEKFKRMMRKITEDEEKKEFPVLSSGIYVNIEQNIFMETRESTASMEMLKALVESKVGGGGFIAVFDGPFESEKMFLPLKENMLEKNIPLLSIAAMKNDMLITVIQFSEGWQYFVGIAKPVQMEEEIGIKKITSYFDDLSAVFSEVVSGESNNINGAE